MIVREAFFLKKIFGFRYRSDPTPYLAKITENLEKYQLFFGLKKESSIEINCSLSIMELDIADPSPPIMEFP